MAREHLKAVWRKALNSKSDVDDSGELMSYRTVVFLALAMMLFLGLARAVSELGLIYVYYRLEPNDGSGRVQVFPRNVSEDFPSGFI